MLSKTVGFLPRLVKWLAKKIKNLPTLLVPTALDYLSVPATYWCRKYARVHMHFAYCLKTIGRAKLAKFDDKSKGLNRSQVVT